MSFIGDILSKITGADRAAKDARRAATEARTDNNALARDIFGQTTARLDPYSNRGLQAGDYYNALIGLPSGVDRGTAEQGFQNYLNLSGFGDELSQGMQGIVGNQAARRLLGSGSTLKSLERYKLGLKGGYLQNYLNNVGNQQASGLNAASALAGVGSNYTGQVSANNNSAASAIGNAALARAGMNTNFLSGLIGAAATLSDERAKVVTAKVGELDDGLPIYRFRYTGSDIEHVGPMAQDVALYRPWALGPVRHDGLMTVNYDALEVA